MYNQNNQSAAPQMGWQQPNPMQPPAQLSGAANQFAAPRQEYPTPQQEQKPPQLQSTGGQFGGMYQNPQLNPNKQRSGMVGQVPQIGNSQNSWSSQPPVQQPWSGFPVQNPSNWRLGQQSESIPGAVWVAMGLWSRGGW